MDLSDYITLHFNKTLDETLHITLGEAIEWLCEIRELVNDDSKSVEYRLQKLIDMV